MQGFREFGTVAEMNAFYRDLRARNAAHVEPPPSPPRWREQGPRKVLEPAALEPTPIEPPPDPAPLPVPAKPISRIILAVCAEWKITPQQLRARSRLKMIVVARQVAMRFAKSHASLPIIARELGLADHTTVVSGLRAIERKMNNWPEIAERVERVRAVLEQDTEQ